MSIKYMPGYIVLLTCVVTECLADADYTYKLKAGDTYWSLSEEHYGDPKYWGKIAEANPGVEPKQLQKEQVIVLPEIGSENLIGELNSATSTQERGGGTSSGPADHTYWVDPTVTDTVYFDGEQWSFVPVGVFVELEKRRTREVVFREIKIDPEIFKTLMPKDPRVSK